MLDYLEHYRPTPLESAVVDFYRKNKILSPQDIDLALFVSDAGISLRELPRPSITYELRHSYMIVIDNRMPWEQQRVELAHELGHVLLHSGRQDFMKEDFRALQEFQADRFAFYALVPTFMIANCLVQSSSRSQLVNQLAYAFDVPDHFMDARLVLLEERMRSLVAEEQLAQFVAQERATYDYSFRHALNNRIEYLVKNGAVIGRRLRAEV